MSKKLIAYFSCSGVTKSVAENLAEVTNGDIYEIMPKEAYTNADLDWMDKSSRSTLESKNNLSRPEIAGKVENMEDYDVIFLGFPIWWYVAPKIINTFLESYDFSGKTIVAFCTSGGSGMGKTLEDLKPSCSDSTKWIEGKRFRGNASKEELETWVNSLNI